MFIESTRSEFILRAKNLNLKIDDFKVVLLKCSHVIIILNH
jgi:hypothetical protein